MLLKIQGGKSITSVSVLHCFLIFSSPLMTLTQHYFRFLIWLSVLNYIYTFIHSSATGNHFFLLTQVLQQYLIPGSATVIENCIGFAYAQIPWLEIQILGSVYVLATTCYLRMYQPAIFASLALIWQSQSLQYISWTYIFHKMVL